MTGTTVLVSQAIEMFGVEIDPHLERDVTIPVSNKLQRQGDIILIPTPKAQMKDPKALGLNGYPLVRGENGGNTHLLLGTGAVSYVAREAQAGGNLDIAVVKVDKGAVAYVAHPEHGYLGVAPGTYTVRRQREQADEIRMVAD